MQSTGPVLNLPVTSSLEGRRVSLIPLIQVLWMLLGVCSTGEPAQCIVGTESYSLPREVEALFSKFSSFMDSASIMIKKMLTEKKVSKKGRFLFSSQVSCETVFDV